MLNNILNKVLVPTTVLAVGVIFFQSAQLETKNTKIHELKVETSDLKRTARDLQSLITTLEADKAAQKRIQSELKTAVVELSKFPVTDTCGPVVGKAIEIVKADK